MSFLPHKCRQRTMNISIPPQQNEENVAVGSAVFQGTTEGVVLRDNPLLKNLKRIQKRQRPPSRFPQSNANQAVLPSHNTIVPEECIYVVIDLETTGLSHKLNNIIELAAEILLYDGVPIEDGSYSSLIRPPSTIPAVVSELTGITQEMVMDKPRFPR